ncbi:MAG: addiction module protein [Verrucomicrobiota bacterium]
MTTLSQSRPIEAAKLKPVLHEKIEQMDHQHLELLNRLLLQLEAEELANRLSAAFDKDHELGIAERKMSEGIEIQALALGANDKAELAERLVESLAISQNTSAHKAWLALAKRRRDEVRSGAVATIPGEEGSAMVRKLVGR